MGGMDLPVNNATLLQRVHRIGERLGELCSLSRRPRPAELIRQRATFDKLHDNVRVSPVDPGAIGRNNSRVLHGCHTPYRPQQPLLHRSVGGAADLQGDETIGRQIARLVDDSLNIVCENPKNLVAASLLVEPATPRQM
jgi:hypothetical protein